MTTRRERRPSAADCAAVRAALTARYQGGQHPPQFADDLVAAIAHIRHNPRPPRQLTLFALPPERQTKGRQR